ncbi:GntR family transcriptional regulator [Acuticoccus sp. I52.16.1]|uniref:GntR family transcriptional regulator n=1 Tax=Acuticoccus sp. I52.16.1 TaxID=2928472 RepID=UPI001FD22528|nr:GntR family transcriptional regulator [Acuticoccus sp. I52.16.1]UOM33907.1 GntR family transcriptional regulator [Acuticoccus sp. I52.16.1]
MSIGTEAPPPAGKPARRRSLRDIAYDRIKQKIITCELRPGEVISEAVLSASLDIGRTPVHQALDRLMVDELVEVMPRKGVIVRPLSLHEVHDIIEVRLVNEVYSVRLAAERIGPAETTVLRENLGRMRAAEPLNDYNALIDIDREFHATLAYASRNAILADFLGNLQDRALRFWFVSVKVPGHLKRICQQHTEVVEAVAARDPERAAQAMRHHIEEFRSNVSRMI